MQYERHRRRGGRGPGSAARAYGGSRNRKGEGCSQRSQEGADVTATEDSATFKGLRSNDAGSCVCTFRDRGRSPGWPWA